MKTNRKSEMKTQRKTGTMAKNKAGRTGLLRKGIIMVLAMAAALSLIGSTVVVTAQIYQSTTPNNVFSPIAGTLINLTPSLTGVISIGTLLNGSLTGLSIPVTARTRLMLVLSASASGLTLLNTIVGYASAGLGIT